MVYLHGFYYLDKIRSVPLDMNGLACFQRRLELYSHDPDFGKIVFNFSYTLFFYQPFFSDLTFQTFLAFAAFFTFTTFLTFLAFLAFPTFFTMTIFSLYSTHVPYLYTWALDYL